jgi:dihydroneopterin aldolase
MTLMLASVDDAREAEMVVEAGVDIVEFDGARADVDAIAAAVAKRRRLSATMGDPRADTSALVARTRALGAIGVDEFAVPIDASVLDGLAQWPGEGPWIGVLFADRSLDLALLPRLAATNFQGARLDIASTSRGRLTTHVDAPGIAEFCSRCRQHGLASALGGSLEAPDVPRLLMARPDVLAFRGALREGHSRKGALDADAIQLIRDLIPRGSGIEPVTPESTKPPIECDDELDQIFVRDLVIPARVGAYGHERGVEQTMMFNVHAYITRAPAADDMRAIVSYDLILDAIRIVVGRGHGRFVETFAEEVAALTLEHPRVVSVRARVEKLDVIQGAVGVEIFRSRRDRRPT